MARNAYFKDFIYAHCFVPFIGVLVPFTADDPSQYAICSRLAVRSFSASGKLNQSSPAGVHIETTRRQAMCQSCVDIDERIERYRQQLRSMPLTMSEIERAKRDVKPRPTADTVV